MTGTDRRVPDLSKRVLVLFASTHGQTARIADRLAAGLRERSAAVDVHDLGELPSGLSLKAYGGVVLGASVHGGHHQPAAVEFALHHHAALESMPSAFFSVSLAAADSDDESREAARDYLETFLEDTEWQPALKASFAGALLYSHYGVFERALMRLIAMRHGHGEVKWDQEYTDWDAVDGFAREFASELSESNERSRLR
jgi:menaquinone-dependent protoporphyrinogen oxidase